MQREGSQGNGSGQSQKDGVMTGGVMGQNQGHIGKGGIRVEEGPQEVGCGVKGRGHR